MCCCNKNLPYVVLMREKVKAKEKSRHRRNIKTRLMKFYFMLERDAMNSEVTELSISHYRDNYYFRTRKVSGFNEIISTVFCNYKKVHARILL